MYSAGGRVIRCMPIDVYVTGPTQTSIPLHRHTSRPLELLITGRTIHNNNYPLTTENGIHRPIGSSEKCTRWLQVEERIRIVDRSPAKYRLLHLSGEHQTFVWSDLVLELNHFLRDLVPQSVNRL
jgi:hypothetical protein